MLPPLYIPGKRWFSRPPAFFRPGLLLFAALFFRPAILPAVADLQSLTVTGTLLPGQAITVKFTVLSTNALNINVAIGLSSLSTLATADEAKQVNWLADSYGIFGAGTYWVNDVSATATNLTACDLHGPEGTGLVCGSSNVARPMTVITRLPMELAGGTYYLHILAKENNSFTANANGFSSEDKLTATLAIGGSPTYKLDLKLCDAFSDADSTFQSNTRLNWRIFNNGEAGVPLPSLKWRFYFHDDAKATWTCSTGVQTQVYYPSAAAYFGFPTNPLGSLPAVTLTDCGSSRTTNRYFEWAPSIALQSGTAPYFIPPAGGYAQSISALFFKHGDTGGVVRTNDYSRPTELVSSSTASTDYSRATLYVGGALVCEYSDASTQDPATGLEPCGVSGCSVPTATPTVTPTPTLTPTATYTATLTPTQTPTLTPTQTPCGVARPVCPSCTYTTLALAYTAAGPCDWIELRADIADETLTVTKNIAGIWSQAPNKYTWNATGNVDNLRVSSGMTQLFQVKDLKMNHSAQGGGDVVIQGYAATSMYQFYNVDFSHTSTSNGTTIIQSSSPPTAVQGLVIDRCTFTGDGANNDTAIAFSNAAADRFTFRNSLFRGCTAAININIALAAVFGNVYNCTFDGNTLGVNFRTRMSMKNCLFTNNTTDYTVSTDGTTADFTYCAFEQAVSFGGPGNLFGIVSTNEYVNEAGQDYTLKSGAQCRNAGTAVSGVVEDLSGTARPQEGSTDIGAYEFALAATPTFTPTPSPTPTATRTPQACTAGQSVLFVVGNTTLSAADTLLRDRLVQVFGMTVVTVKDSVALTSDSAGKALVLISASIDPNALAGRYRDVAVPVFVLENGVFDEMRLTWGETTSNGTQATQTALDILQPGHALAGGLSGSPAVFSPAATLGWGVATAGATVVASQAGNAAHAAIFSYAKNAAMVGISAPEKRLGWFGDESQANFTANAWTLFDAGVDWLTCAAVPTATVTPTFTPGGGDGLTARFYNDTALYNMTDCRVLPQVYMKLNGGEAPVPSVPGATWSVRFNGQVRSAFNETYTFYVTGDDGWRLRINGVLLAEDWSPHGMREVSGSVALAAGAMNSIELEFFQNQGGQGLELRWSSPSTPYDLIPQSCLYSASAACGAFTSTPTRTPVPAGTPQADNFNNASLAPFWTTRNIGLTTAVGLTETTALTITAQGCQDWGGPDELSYIFQPVSGDFDITLKVLTVAGANSEGRTGLMMRSGEENYAPMAFMQARQTGEFVYQARSANAASAAGLYSATGFTQGTAAWLRLRRQGNDFYGYHSPNGLTWTAAGSVTLVLPSAVLLGIAANYGVCGGSTGSSIVDDFGVAPVATATPSITPSITQTWTYTRSVTPSITQTRTVTPSITQTSTFTPSITQTSTITPSITQTSTVTPSITQTRTITPSITQTSTITPSITQTSTITPSITQTSTITPSITQTRTITASITQTSTITPSITQTSTITPSITQTSTITPSITQTRTITASITQTSTITPSITQTSTITPSITQTSTITPSITQTQTITASITQTSTITPSITQTSTITPSITQTSTLTPSITQTSTITPSITQTSTITPSITQTRTITPSITQTSTITPSVTQTSTITPSVTQTSTITPSITQTSTITPSITQTSTITPSITQSSTITPSITQTATITPSITQTSTVTPSITQTSTITPSVSQTSTITPSITETSTVTPSITETSTITPSITPTSTITPSTTATPTSTASPTFSASPSGTVSATVTITPLLIDDYNVPGRYNASQLDAANQNSQSHGAVAATSAAGVLALSWYGNAASDYWNADVGAPGACFDGSPFEALTFRIRGTTGGESFAVNLVDLDAGCTVPTDHPLALTTYAQVGTQWQTVQILLADFGGTLARLRGVVLNQFTTASGGIELDDLLLLQTAYTATATQTPSVTPTFTPSTTGTLTATPSVSPTSTMTASITETSTATPTVTQSQSSTPSITPTSTISPSITPSPTETPSFTGTTTDTPTGTTTPTETPSATGTFTRTETCSATATPSLTSSATESFTFTETRTCTATPTQTPSATDSFTPTGTRSATATPTQTFSFTDSFTPTGTRSATATPTQTFSFTDSFTPTGTRTGTATLTPTPSVTQSASASATATASGTRTPAATATATPSFSASPSFTETSTPCPACSPTTTATPVPAAPAYEVTLRIYDSSGVLLRTVAAGRAAAPLAGLTLSSDPYDPAGGALSLSDGTWTWAFDGLDGQGQLLRNGAYVVDAETQGAGHVRADLRVLGQGQPLVLLQVGPNPVRPGSGPLRLLWQPPVPVELKIYSMNGELVKDLGLCAGPGAEWSLQSSQGTPAANGLYWVAARRPGERLPRLFKLMVAR
jgi:hypothetical protein